MNETSSKPIVLRIPTQDSAVDSRLRMTDVWSAAAGLRFEYYDTWFEVDEAYEGPIDNLEAHLFNMVHACLVLLVEDAYSNGDHLPEENV